MKSGPAQEWLPFSTNDPSMRFSHLSLFTYLSKGVRHVLCLLFWLFVTGCASPYHTAHDIQPVVRGDVLLTVYVIRHAESKKNVWHFPWTPKEQLDMLTAKGRRQAAALGHFLKDKAIVAIFSSPTGRTRETAHIINDIIQSSGGMKIEENFASLRGGKNADGIPISWDWREQ